MTRQRSSDVCRKAVCPRIEVLEDRLALSWAAVPPATIALPFSPTVVTLNRLGDAGGTAWINSEVDTYRFVAPVAGKYRITTATPTGPLNTVVGVFNALGQRIASNNDAPGTTDSDVSVSLTAGKTYFVGITNLNGTPGGGYQWKIDGPVWDDSYEDNDTRLTARSLGSLSQRFQAANLVMGDTADWYKFTMAGTGTKDNFVRITFQHAQGDLDVRLYNASGALVGASLGDGNAEMVTLAGLSAGTYFVQVYGWQAFNPNYSLEIVPGLGADDAYEDNDALAKAANLGTVGPIGEYDLKLVDSADWFRFTMVGPATGPFGVLATHTSPGTLQLGLYDATGKLLRTATPGYGGMEMSLFGLGAGTYYLKVTERDGTFVPVYHLQIWGGEADDKWEDNDTMSQATWRGDNGSHGGIWSPSWDLVLADVDWFRIVIEPYWNPDPSFSPGGVIYIDSRYGAGMDVELYNSQGKLIGSGGGGWIWFSDLQGEYFLKFTPRGAYTRYSFGVNGNSWDDGL